MANTMQLPIRPMQIFQPHPVLGWVLTPGGRVRVPFRDDIVQSVGNDGWRVTTGCAPNPDMRLAIYGCSFTYGTGLADSETFGSLIADSNVGVSVLNRGVGGYGTVHNLIQFRRDIATGSVDAAIFAIISDHRFRNIAHPQKLRQHLSAPWHEIGVEHMPIAMLERDGSVCLKYVSIWQPSLLRDDFSVFLPDDVMIDLATKAVLHEVRHLARDNGIPVIFALLDQLDPGFNKALLDEFEMAVDISTPFDDEHIFLPDDIHPNPNANRLFAQRLMEPVAKLRQAVGKLAS